MKRENKNSVNRLTVSLLCLLYLMIMLFVTNKTNAQAQNKYTGTYRNTIYFESIGATGLGASVNFKHSVWIGKNTSINASAGFGCILYSFNEKQDIVFPISLTIGHGTNHSFEWGVGVSVIAMEKIIAPNITLGYHYQKGPFFFWAGIVTLLFFDQYTEYDYGYTYQKSKWDLMGFIPAPGIRLGKSF